MFSIRYLRQIFSTFLILCSFITLPLEASTWIESYVSVPNATCAKSFQENASSTDLENSVPPIHFIYPLKVKDAGAQKFAINSYIAINRRLDILNSDEVIKKLNVSSNLLDFSYESERQFPEFSIAFIGFLQNVIFEYAYLKYGAESIYFQNTVKNIYQDYFNSSSQLSLDPTGTFVVPSEYPPAEYRIKASHLDFTDPASFNADMLKIKRILDPNFKPPMFHNFNHLQRFSEFYSFLDIIADPNLQYRKLNLRIETHDPEFIQFLKTQLAKYLSLQKI